MEEKNPIRTSLVSKLPKYGTKSLGSTLQPMSNRTAVPLSGNSHSSSGKNCSKHNGTVHMSSFAFSWQKSNKYQLGDQSGGESNSAQNSNEKLIDSEKYSPSQGGFGKDVLRVGLNSTSSVASKTAKQVNMFVSSTEELNQKSLPGLSSSAKFTKGTLFGRTSYSGLSAPKSHLNGFYGNRPSVDLQRCRINSNATRTSSGESLAQSTDNAKSLSCEKMVRSQSFSHSIQNSFLPAASLTRSHSFNKAVDLTRPYQKQHLAIRASQRSTLLSRNAQQLDAPSGNEPLRYGFTRPCTAISASGLRKPLLSNGSGVSPSLGYGMSRPSLLKPTRQQFTGKIIVDNSKSTSTEMCIVKVSEITVNVNGAIERKDLENDSQRTECGEALHDSLGKHGSKVICMNDDVDEISISSLSSSEKNDLSEDFSDDFIDLEDSNRTIQVKQEVPIEELGHGGATPVDPVTSLKESESPHCNTDEWLDIDVSAVDDKNESTKHTIGNNLISPDMDYRAGSSFELSPSDSSDGTYMWDEEGLEPIGSVHPCGSYESSEMNSIDILNNLDSCDLEDDDLMLDVDLPEDTPCDNVECENMNRYDRQDRNTRQQQDGFWKRTPQRWSAQDHYHLGHAGHFPHGKNDLSRGSSHLEPPIGHFEGYGAPNIYQTPRQLVGLRENTVMLDEMTLRHMVQDCTAVKTQLLKLKRLLHQPQVLQPSSSLPSSTDLAQGKLIKTPHIEARSEYPKQGLHENDDHHSQNAANGSHTNSLNELNILLSKRLNIKDLNENEPFEENLKVKKSTKEPGELASNEDSTLQSLPSSCQTPTQMDARDVQTKLAAKSQPSSSNQASQPKTLRASEPPNQNALVPPTVANTASSPNCSTASKAELPPPSSATQLQPTSSQTHLKSKPSQRISKLRPPTISFVKSKQISSPMLISPEPQNSHSKTNIPRPLAQRKENVQNQNTSLRSGDSLVSNRHSRLPKPKTH
ncbi:serine-rich coiled-coil domain-containing protein 2 isoform X6 [Chrysemys picta bellii]|uniref:serine-rich coiled-coil domain-containing protein 2 isoform X6 n=1 Tax=Chrysemys picta bellii TaxID=8478 RepID=UPI0032B16C4A